MGSGLIQVDSVFSRLRRRHESLHIAKEKDLSSLATQPEAT